METEQVDVSGAYRRFAAWTPALRKYVAEEMGEFVLDLPGYTIGRYLSGDPLHNRHGGSGLAGSLNSLPIEQTDTEIRTAYGSNLIYAYVHEVGGSFHIPEHERLLTQVFGRKVDPHKITVRAHDAYFPKRSFIGPTIEDKAGTFRAAMDRAATAAAEEANGAA